MSSFTEPLEYEPYKYLKGRQLYTITRDITYCVGSLEDPFWKVTIPKGFVTDLATIPWPFRLIFKPNGKYVQAAVLHDYLIMAYKTNRGKTFTRLTIDAIFYEAMLVLGVNRIIASIFYYTVRVYANLTSQL